MNDNKAYNLPLIISKFKCCHSKRNAEYLMNIDIVTLKINPFHATGLFLYPLKKSENQRFSDTFAGYRKRPVA